jgi:hypothetical protein
MAGFFFLAAMPPPIIFFLAAAGFFAIILRIMFVPPRLMRCLFGRLRTVIRPNLLVPT